MSPNLYRYRLKAIVCALILICFNQISAAQLLQAPYNTPILSGHIVNPVIKEASGMIASSKNQGIFWIHNDGGHGPYLFAVTNTGEHKGTFQITDAENIDWEDIALFYLKGSAYLLIADVGDNLAQRSNYVLYAVAEPMVSQSDSESRRTLQIVWRQRFKYEDGPKDCEAVTVDVEDQKILLLSKRDTQPVLYYLPLLTGEARQFMVARKIISVPNIPPPTQTDLQFRYGKYRSQPTAMDLSPSGREMVVLTYKNAYSYKHLKGEDWIMSFTRPPMVIYLPALEKTKLRQREALCFDSNGRTLFVTAEGQFAPIYRLDRKNH